MVPRRISPALSPVIATMLLVGITVVLGALVYLLVAGYPSLLRGDPAGMYQDLRIVQIYDDSGTSPYANCKKSCMVLINSGVKPVRNADLSVRVTTNGKPVDCNIFSLHSQTYNFSPLRHGVERIAGEGTRGETWNPGEEILIDFSNGTFHPGDEVEIEFISGSGGTVVSRDSYRMPA